MWCHRRHQCSNGFAASNPTLPAFLPQCAARARTVLVTLSPGVIHMSVCTEIFTQNLRFRLGCRTSTIFPWGLEHRYDRFLTPHSRGTFIYLCLVRWWAFFSCGNMLGHQFSLTWHSGHQECMVPGVAWNSLIYAVMTLRTHWDCDLCVL